MFKILIVDDNHNNLFTIKILLEEFGNITIKEAHNGNEAYELCQKEYFDLILMDIMMPQIDGFEATRLIKELHPKVMIVAISALDNESTKNKILSNGAEDYITKPIDADLFIQRITNYLEILTFRNSQKFNSLAKNPFTKEIFSRFTQFNISQKNHIAEFWDFFLNKEEKYIVHLSDYVRIIYSLGLWLIEHEHNFEIVFEENETHIYLIQSNISAIHKNIIKNIIDKNLPQSIYAFAGDTLVFEIPKVIKKVTINEEQQAVIYLDEAEKMSAKEYIDTTPINVLPKIDALENIELELEMHIMKLENNLNKEILDILLGYFYEYSSTIDLLGEFGHIAHGLNSLCAFLSAQEDIDKLDTNQSKQLIKILSGLLDDLIHWRLNIFEEQKAQDIHYMDTSLLNSCLEVELLFDTEKKEECGDVMFF